MYKSSEDYSSIQLFKEDLIELEKVFKQKFGDIDRYFLSVETPNQNLSGESLEQLLVDSSLNIKYISFHLYKYNENHSVEKYFNIHISKISVSVNIEGVDDIWVNGMKQFSKSLLKKKKSKILAFSNFIPAIAGGIIGANASLVFFGVINNSYFSIILSSILLIFGIILSSHRIMRKVFPLVRISLKEKRQIDRNEVYTLLGIIIGVLGLVVSVISLF